MLMTSAASGLISKETDRKGNYCPNNDYTREVKQLSKLKVYIVVYISQEPPRDLIFSVMTVFPIKSIQPVCGCFSLLVNLCLKCWSD